MERLGKWRAFYLRQAGAIGASGRRLDRVHEKMATLYAAGSLAIEFGILPWTRPRLIRALLSCTRAHVALVAREQADATRRQAAPLDLLRQ